MTVPSQELSLAAEFEPATLDAWRRLALGVLRKSGRAAEDTGPEAVDDLLGVRTYDGIAVAPLYTAAAPVEPTGVPGVSPFTRGTDARQGWDVRQRHAEPEVDDARQAVLNDLGGGATSIWLVLAEGGLRPADLPRVLDGVLLDLAGIVLQAPPAAAEAAAEALVRLGAERATPVSGNLGLDPLGWAASSGGTADLGPAVAWARTCAASHPGLRAVTVDATVYHDAGATEAEELGASLATGVAYLRALTGAGLDLTTALSQLEFRYAANADQFLTVAKFRAARRLWARVAQACGEPAGAGQRQHAVTSAAMMTARDPWANMLRTTVACFGAGVGGAGAITVLPFDSALGVPDAFGARIARNTQSLLLDEAHVGQVLDPAGGSWYVESLTRALSTAAWAWFQEIERAGGMAAALDSGLIRDRLAGSWAKRRANLATRRDPIVGVSEFANLAERRPQRRPAPAMAGGGLPRHRYGEQFEALRDRCDAHEAATGARPRILLATLGTPASHSGRVSFATNLFGAAGIECVTAPLDEVPPGFAMACLCGSDKSYADSPDAAATLAGAGVRHVWLAGRPGDHLGVESYVYSGVDAVEALAAALRDLGVA